MNKTILMLFFLLLVRAGMAQTEVKDLMYKAYLTSSREEWEKALETQLRSVNGHQDFNSQMQLAYCYFSLLNGTLATHDKAFFYRHLDPAKQLVKQLIESNENSGEAKAILSAIYGIEISHSPIKGMMLGSKSSGLAEKAKILKPDSPLVMRVYAANKFYTPTTFGGDVKIAIGALYNSISLFERQPDKILHDWLYLDTLALLGQALEKDKQTARAIEIYEKALKIEPRFNWVKQVLLPRALTR